MSSLFDLTGRYALVTGASSGIGVQFAKALAKQGATVAICARRVELLEAVRSEIEADGGHCIAVRCDIMDEESVKECVETVKKEFGRIDILVNNAGCTSRHDLVEFPTEQWDRILATNLRGTFFTCREVAKLMKENKYGRIINISSAVCTKALSGTVAYCASKGGEANITRALAVELGPYGITVNCIAPGIFLTEITQDKMLNDFVKDLIARTPVGRMGAPGDMDGLLIYLASDCSSFCNGQVIGVDGGITIAL